nr:putative transcription factor sol4 [Quercus suber]
MFAERVLQLRLNRFWRGFDMRRSVEYDPTQTELRYERFCMEYLSTLPPAFALEPDTQWDARLPKLAMQRQVLRICIFDCICWNFRPLLLLKPTQWATLAPYKQVLLRSQKKVLATAALQELEAITALHSMLNDAYTRFSIVIFNTFEAAVLLLTLCSESHSDVFLDEDPSSTYTREWSSERLTPERLLQAAEKALSRLRKLADVSDMAASGARVVDRLFTNVTRDVRSARSSTMASSRSSSLAGPLSSLYGDEFDIANWTSDPHSDPNVIAELLSTITEEEWASNVAWPQMNL